MAVAEEAVGESDLAIRDRKGWEGHYGLNHSRAMLLFAVTNALQTLSHGRSWRLLRL